MYFCCTVKSGEHIPKTRNTKRDKQKMKMFRKMLIDFRSSEKRDLEGQQSKEAR